MPSHDLPRVGISACLLGDRVRYDGGHRKQAELLTDFNGQVEWLATCPEVELGLGIPRQTIQIERHEGELRLVSCNDRQDLTTSMNSWANDRISFLQSQHICGYVLKARSPSCGVGTVSVAGTDELTSGLFAAMLAKRLPDLPLIEEDQLTTSEARQHFLQRVYSYCRLPRTNVIG